MTVALTIAGSDPSGGAGLQADLKTFHHFGLFGTSVVTLLTVQNTQKVSQVQCLETDFVIEQYRALIDDVPPAAAKTGAIGNSILIQAVATMLSKRSFPLVVDPVMISKHGDRLIDDDAVEVLQSRLIPIADVVTPNRHEAALLAGKNTSPIQADDLDAMTAAGRVIAAMGPRSVLVKGGVRDGTSIDVLVHDDNVHHIESPLVQTTNTHGTGCVLSAAITSQFALGLDPVAAVVGAKEFLFQSLYQAPKIGRGIGPVNFFFGQRKS